MDANCRCTYFAVIYCNLASSEDAALGLMAPLSRASYLALNARLPTPHMYYMVDVRIGLSIITTGGSFILITVV